jgi:hypothetical protein
MPPKNLTSRQTKKTAKNEDDHRKIEAAKKRNGSKPGIPWSEAKRRLGLAD